MFGKCSARGTGHAGSDQNTRDGISAAFAQGMNLKGRPKDEIRAAVESELSARKITNVSAVQIDFLIETIVTSPYRALIARALVAAKKVRAICTLVKAHATPNWTQSPEGIRRLDWRNDQKRIRASIRVEDLGTGVAARIFEEVPKVWQHVETSTEPAVRAFPCWVSIEADDEAAKTITVHVGKYVLGKLQASDSRIVREILSSKGVAAIELDATAVDGVDQFIRVGVPDRV